MRVDGGLLVSESSLSPKERDEFTRIGRLDQIDRDRLIIARYEEGMAFYRNRIEDNRYELGRLDERLGG